MINTKFVDGYEGEGQVLVYYKSKEEANGMLIWEGYFEYLLSACYKEKFLHNGFMESYYTHSGFYDESPWEIQDIQVILDELEGFCVNNMETSSYDIIKIVAELRDELLLFLKKAYEEREKVLIDYN